MAKGMLRGAAGAWLGLVMLQALTQKNGADAVGGLLGTVDKLVKHALDPSVPALPDFSKTAPTGNAPGGGTATVVPDGHGGYTPDGGQLTPDGRYLPPTDSTIPQPHAPGSGTVQSDAYRIPWPAPATYNV